jgi:hypothetical protein
MIPNRPHALANVTGIITGRIAQINAVYRGGPSFYFYHRIIGLRTQHPTVATFLASNTCIEILYATLVSWDMNSRGAKMKDYDDFRNNLRGNLNAFQAVEGASNGFSWANRNAVVHALSNLYDQLSLMQTNGKLVSNSKALHFVFPALCPPMDRTNTLQKLYGNTAESKNKFLEVLEFSYDILGGIQNPQQYLDNQWNTSETKLVDNAIILM